MIITRKWLEKSIDLKNVSNDQITVALNSLGFEVEETCDLSKLNGELIIGHVLHSEPIEGTHLRFNKVNVGSQELDIVCGAPNVDKGQFVIVALPGVTISNGMTLDIREIRGYRSHGMICSLTEIGLSANVLTDLENDSIYEIESNEDLTKLIGKSVSEINFNDFIWDMDLTLNRSDALSAIQLAKEISNYFNLELNLQSLIEVNTNKNLEVNGLTLTTSLTKEELNTISIASLKVKSGKHKVDAKDDLWLKISGSKTTDNFYEDLANASAIISGQPIILVDADKIKSLNLTKMLIDNKEMVVLLNEDSIVNILGNKTEEAFKVTDTTVNVLAIMINASKTLMRKQQKTLNTSNVDIQRYIKPLNPNLSNLALSSLVKILEQYDVLEAFSDVKKIIDNSKWQNKVITLTLQKIKDFLGIEISAKEVIELFKNLDFTISYNEAIDGFTFVADENRTDLYGQNDICEEVARLYGYDNIKEVPPMIVARKNSKNTNQKLQTKLTDYLIGKGFNNVKTYSLIEKDEVEKWNLFNIDEPISLMSPLSKIRETYRTNLAKSLVDVAIYNSSVDNKHVQLFEIADIYAKNLRERHLSLLISGNLIEDRINKFTIESNYFYLKGIVEEIFKLYKVDLSKITFANNEEVIDEIHPFINAEIKFEDELIGYIFKLNPKFENVKKINKTFVVELNINLLEKLSQKIYSSKELSKFQQSSRDISLLISKNDKYEEIVKNMIIGVNNLISIKLLDEYFGEELDANNQKSLAISLVFNNLDHQLTENEINEEWSKVLSNVSKMDIKVR
ncbi:phenylalanine--tRNA ligase subunit beta [Mesoplasma photuris]|uniref:phenylalanine--tRNA ligase subunit beta n=1 Tax=Mesoplasma photuris TaxID=217731 RepID=UPI0004E0DCCE|nr:phenylalanine--tRNA ligase subunit beta [Mesoplasma photuris]